MRIWMRRSWVRCKYESVYSINTYYRDGGDTRSIILVYERMIRAYSMYQVWDSGVAT